MRLMQRNAELRAAVEAFEAFLGKELQPGVDVPTAEANEIEAA